LLDKEVDGKQEIREVVETKSGSLDRLLATAGRPLTDAQQRDETVRILRISHSPEAQHKLEQTHRKDVAQCSALLQLIPDAFLFDYAAESGGLAKLNFKPNPDFQPSSREGKVLHEMAKTSGLTPSSSAWSASMASSRTRLSSAAVSWGTWKREASSA
jgi:hypothetical protein